jgi:hypothetical protein
MLPAEPVQITYHIAQVFERLHIRYFVGGSLASSLHGIPRATQDVDIVAEILSGQIPLIVESLESEFHVDSEMIEEAIQHSSSFNVIHLTTMFKVDIFILKSDTASQEEMVRRERYQVSDDPQQMLFLATAEDVILHKLYRYQLGGGVSERQWSDVLGVLQVQHDTLDRAYLKKAAQQRGVIKLLKEAFNEADIEEIND